MGAPAKITPIRQAAAPPPKQPATRKRKKRPDPQPLQEAELASLFRAIDDSAGLTTWQRARDRAIFRVAYHAGLRASEVGLVELRDYDRRTDRLSVTRLKGSNSGQHHMVREEARALKAWLKQRGEAPGAIFLSRRGQPISRKQLHVLIRQYGAAAGIPVRLLHFHTLKHSCCTHLFNRGVNLENVQDWVGHADPRNTMIYGKVTNQRRDQVARQLKNWK